MDGDAFTSCNSTYRLRYWNDGYTQLCGVSISCNSTYRLRYWNSTMFWHILSVPNTLQQYLPFTVLKLVKEIPIWASSCCNSTYRLRYWNFILSFWTDKNIILLQQYLPFTVLKRHIAPICFHNFSQYSCNSTYRLRYWNKVSLCSTCSLDRFSCNSTYRLRYWNFFYYCYGWSLQVATVLTVYGIETLRPLRPRPSR